MSTLAAAAMACLLAALVPPPPALAREPAAPVVNCYDPERGIVQTTLPHRCEGRIVSEEEASRIEAARRRERARRLDRETGSASPQRKAARSYGTAFPAGTPGRYLTARHTVEDCLRITLATEEGERFDAELAAAAQGRDIALLSASEAIAPFAIAQSPPPTDGQALAIGYSNQGLPVLRPQSRQVAILGHGRSPGQGQLIAFRGAIRGGASGGPLLGADGKVIGMIVSKVDTPAVFAAAGRLVRDIAFALDAAELTRFLERHAARPAAGAKKDGGGDEPHRRVLRVVCER